MVLTSSPVLLTMNSKQEASRTGGRQFQPGVGFFFGGGALGNLHKVAKPGFQLEFILLPPEYN